MSIVAKSFSGTVISDVIRKYDSFTNSDTQSITIYAIATVAGTLSVRWKVDDHYYDTSFYDHVYDFSLQTAGRQYQFVLPRFGNSYYLWYQGASSATVSGKIIELPYTLGFARSDETPVAGSVGLTDGNGNAIAMSGGAVSVSQKSVTAVNQIDVSTGILISSAARTLHRVDVANKRNDLMLHLKIYDTASAPTVGTTTPLFTYGIYPQSYEHFAMTPTTLTNGLGLACTLKSDRTDTSLCNGGDCLVNLQYGIYG